LRTNVNKPDVRALFYNVQTFDDYYAVQEQIKNAMIFRGLWPIEEIKHNYKYANLKTSTASRYEETTCKHEAVTDATININLPSTYTVEIN
jgi:hypothetical protein